MTTPTPEAIEAAARALCGTPFPDTWEKLGADIQALYRHEAEDALAAALPFIAAQAKGEAFQAVRDAAEVEPDQVGDYGMVELPGYLTIDTRAFDALDKDDRERLHITADDYAQAIDGARAQAKAEALREAADEIRANQYDDLDPFYADYLVSRANRLEGKDS